MPFGFLLNKQDAEAVAQNTHNRTMDLHRQTKEIYENMALKREARSEKMKDDTAFILAMEVKQLNNIIEQQRERINVLVAQLDAVNGLVKDKLANGGDPARMEQVRQIRSRREDAELDRMLREGHIKNDPRKNPQWVEHEKYRPA